MAKKFWGFFFYIYIFFFESSYTLEYREKVAIPGLAIQLIFLIGGYTLVWLYFKQVAINIWVYLCNGYTFRLNIRTLETRIDKRYFTSTAPYKNPVTRIDLYIFGCLQAPALNFNKYTTALWQVKFYSRCIAELATSLPHFRC